MTDPYEGGTVQFPDLRVGWSDAPLDHGYVTEALATILDYLPDIPEERDYVAAREVLDSLYERMTLGRATVKEDVGQCWRSECPSGAAEYPHARTPRCGDEAD